MNVTCSAEWLSDLITTIFSAQAGRRGRHVLLVGHNRSVNMTQHPKRFLLSHSMSLQLVHLQLISGMIYCTLLY